MRDLRHEGRRQAERGGGERAVLQEAALADALPAHDFVERQQLGAFDAVLGRGGLEGRRHATLPAVQGQEVGDAANGVGGAGRQVDVAVGVEVDREAVDAAGHELRQADGTRKGADQRSWGDGLLARQQQQFLEFVAEVGAAVAAAGREVERQRGQGIEGAETAHHAAVVGLDADDAHDHLGRHAEARLGACQGVGVGLPEGDTGGDALRLDEAVAVGVPVFRLPGWRRHHQLLRHGLEPGVVQLLQHPGRVPAAAAGDIVGKGAHLGAAVVRADADRCGHGGAGREQGGQQEQDDPQRHRPMIERADPGLGDRQAACISITPAAVFEIGMW
jgi:hypothetical protein